MYHMWNCMETLYFTDRSSHHAQNTKIAEYLHFKFTNGWPSCCPQPRKQPKSKMSFGMNSLAQLRIVPSILEPKPLTIAWKHSQTGLINLPSIIRMHLFQILHYHHDFLSSPMIVPLMHLCYLQTVCAIYKCLCHLYLNNTVQFRKCTKCCIEAPNVLPKVSVI